MSEKLHKVLSLRKIAFLAFAIGLGLGTGHLIRVELRNQTATLDVEARISNGTRFNVYFNNRWAEPQTQPVAPNQLRHYFFPVPSQLTSLRLDPSEQDKANIIIRSITLRSDGGMDSNSLDLSQLSQWLTSHIQVSLQPDHSVLLSTDAISSYMMNTVNLSIRTNSFFGAIRLTAGAFLLCFVACLGVTVLLGFGREDVPQALLTVLLLAGAFLLFHVLALWLLKLPADLPAPTYAVGAAAFSGFSLHAEARALDVPIVIIALLVLVAGLIWRWKRNDSPIPKFVLDRAKISYSVLFLLLLVSAAFSYPSAGSYLASALSGKQPADFDAQNIFVWEFLSRMGKLPFRDFWFPYSGFANRLAPLYPDFLIEFFHEVLLLAVLLWSGLKIFRNRWGILLIFGSVFFFLTSQRIFWPGSASRYFLSLSLVLLAAVAIQELSVFAFIALGVWAVYVLSQEVSQLISSTPGFVLLGVVAFARPDNLSNRKRLFRVMTAGIISGASALVAFLANLFFHGQLSQWWIFVSTLNTSADYGAWPARVADWLLPTGGLDSAFVLLTLLLIVGGTLQILFRKKSQDIYALLPLCIGLLSFVALQKQIVRAGIETQILPFPVFGLLLLVCQQMQGLCRQRQVLWATFSSGLLFSCFLYQPGVRAGGAVPWLENAIALPKNLRATFSRRSDWKKARETFFAASSYNMSGLGGDQIRDQLNLAAPTQPDESVFVLGNEPLLYAWMNKPVPFYTNIYNESPLESQTTMLSWLKTHRPKYLFWDSKASDFDGVPNSVRLPVLYAFFVENYKPSGSAANFEVLKRVETGDQPDLVYWSKMLGATTDLGYIPNASVLAKNASKGQTTQALLVHLSNPKNGWHVNIPIIAGDLPLSIAFSVRGARQDFVIRLDRVPMVEAERQSKGGRIQIGSLATGIQASVSNILVPVDDLY